MPGHDDRANALSIRPLADTMMTDGSDNIRFQADHHSLVSMDASHRWQSTVCISCTRKRMKKLHC
jgi:hypothetical protein